MNCGSHQPGAVPAVYVPIRAPPALGIAGTLASAWVLKVVPSGAEYSIPS